LLAYKPLIYHNIWRKKHSPSEETGFESQSG